MSDEQQKKPADSGPPAGENESSDRPALGSATLGGLADLVKASQAASGGAPGAAINLGGLAELVKAEPKKEAPAPAPVSPFDQKVGAAASQYTFVMNSSDLQDIIGDPNKQRVSVHSTASAGFDSAPRPAHSEAPPRPATADLAAPPPTRTRDLPGPRAASRGPVVHTKPERSSTTAVLLVVAAVLLFVFLLLQRNATLENSVAPPSPSTSEARAAPEPTEAP